MMAPQSMLQLMISNQTTEHLKKFISFLFYYFDIQMEWHLKTVIMIHKPRKLLSVKASKVLDVHLCHGQLSHAVIL